MRLIIEKKEGKGRSFSAELVSWAEADPLWNTTETKNRRPIWAVFAGPAEELRAFTANLLLGHVASNRAANKWNGRRDKEAECFEFLKSAGYRAWTRPLPAGGVAVTFCLPHLLSWTVPQNEDFHHKFAVIPALSQISAWRFNLEAAFNQLRALEDAAFAAGVARHDDGYDWRALISHYSPAMKLAELKPAELHRHLCYGALLLHYLESRLAQPLPRVPTFGAWLFLLGIEQGAIRTPERKSRDQERSGYAWEAAFQTTDPDRAGAAPGFSFNGARFGGTPEQQAKAIREWLGAEVVRWFNVTGGA